MRARKTNRASPTKGRTIIRERWYKRRMRWRAAVRAGRFDGGLDDWARAHCPIVWWAAPYQKPDRLRVRLGRLGERYRARIQWRTRYTSDPAFRMQEIIRAQVRKMVCPSKKGSRRTLELLGFDRDELVRHIERQFMPGMTWDAVRDGRVHIDHVIPRAAFDMSDIDEVRRCWSLPNLRPLWAEENRRKHEARTHLC